jgi:hypothetical protein
MVEIAHVNTVASESICPVFGAREVSAFLFVAGVMRA